MRYTGDDSDVEITQYNVRKYGARIPISEELLVDSLPFIGPERPPIVPTRWQKIQRWMLLKVASIRLRSGSWIAGVDLEDRELD